MKKLLFFILPGLILVVMVGCARLAVDTIQPIPSPVPIATWIAQGVPDDTVIKYGSTNQLWGGGVSVTIYADGTIESASTHLDKSSSGTGQISQEELKRILTEFAEVDFLSLAVKDGIVYNSLNPPAEGSKTIIVEDTSMIYISLTLHGKTHSISYESHSSYVDYEFKNPITLSSMLFELGNRFAGEPK